MRTNVWVGTVALAAFASPAAAEMTCWGPRWTTMSSPTLAVSADFSADVYAEYYLREGFPSMTVSERARPGDQIAGRCVSSFSVGMTDFGSKSISDSKGLFDSLLNNVSTPPLRDFKLKRNRALTVGGYPARDIVYSFTIDYFFTPASHRLLYVARGNRLYTFYWVWGDGGDVPADAERMFGSIRFNQVQPTPHLATLALLQETIKDYWLDKPSARSSGHLSAALRRIADPKRVSESAIVRGFGFFDSPTFNRMENGYKVIRIDHQYAVVDWYVQDNGREITALTWKKVRDKPKS